MVNRKKKEEGSRGRKLIFWNIAGLGNKDKEFWKFIRNYDYTSISLCETWVEEKGWDMVRNRLPKSHEWACSFAKKEKKKERAKGGFVIGISKR